MSDARILEQGYRRYDGPRQGTGHAIRSLIVHTLRRVLGLRRPARSKVIPVLTIFFAYVPAIVFVGLIALVGTRGGQLVPRYFEYYGFIISAILLFVAFVSPEALCPDRRSRSLSLYLASPLTRQTYLFAKVSAVAIVLSAVTIGPPLLLLLGLSAQGVGPHGFDGWMLVFGRILLSGVIMTAMYTAVSMGISSLTDRYAFAAATTILLMIGSAVVSGIVREGLRGPAAFLLLNLNRAPIELIARVYGRPGEVPQVSTFLLALGVGAWTAVGAGVTYLRYRSLQVTR